MSKSQNVECISRPAGADLSAYQYRFVKLNTSGQVVLCGNTEDAVGVLYNKPESGQTAQVVVAGRAKVELGATVAINARVMSNANGQAIASTGAGAFELGKAMLGGGSGEIGEVLLGSANII